MRSTSLAACVLCAACDLAAPSRPPAPAASALEDLADDAVDDAVDDAPGWISGAPADGGARAIGAASAVIATDAANTPPWLPPLVGRITSEFGERDDGALHDAVDIAAPMGTAVVAPVDLRIRTIAYKTNAGRFIVADTVADDDTDVAPGHVITFAHLSHVDVVEGQQVERGELLGLSGNSGRATGPHLHLRVERIEDGARVAVDPVALFGRASLTGEAGGQ